MNRITIVCGDIKGLYLACQIVHRFMDDGHTGQNTINFRLSGEQENALLLPGSLDERGMEYIDELAGLDYFSLQEEPAPTLAEITRGRNGKT